MSPYERNHAGIDVMTEYGPGHRIWPGAADGASVYATVSTTRLSCPPSCKLLHSRDAGSTWDEVLNFSADSADPLTTGQPFLTDDGVILVPVWHASYYELGTTGLYIYRSEDRGRTWDIAYANHSLTYGKHFFPGSTKGEVFLCAGIGGGGHDGTLAFTPANGVLLKSIDHGVTWQVALTIETPTAIYDGIAISDTVIVTARERGSVFRSPDGGATWQEVPLTASARCVAQIDSHLIVSSDSSVFLSSDNGITWHRHCCSIPGLFLRYPTADPAASGSGLLTAVGWRSLLLRIALPQGRWSVAADFSRLSRAASLTRLAAVDGSLLVGDETPAGILVRIPNGSLRNASTLPYAIIGQRFVRRTRSAGRLLLSSALRRNLGRTKATGS